jgi:hypothetical protein
VRQSGSREQAAKIQVGQQRRAFQTIGVASRRHAAVKNNGVY